AIEMKVAYGSHRLLRQPRQQTEPVEDALTVRLQNLATESLRWPGRLLEDQGPDAFLGESESEHRSAASGAHDDDIRLFHGLSHHQGVQKGRPARPQRAKGRGVLFAVR